MGDFKRYEDDPLLEELTGEGYAAVVAAVDSYESHHGMKLSSWLWRKITHAIIRAIEKEEKWNAHHWTVDFQEFDNDDDFSDEWNNPETAPVLQASDTGWYHEPDGSGSRAMEWKAEYDLIKQRLTPYDAILLDCLLEGRTSIETAQIVGCSQSKAYRDCEKLKENIRDMNKI
jgi:DNA-directed RNA polymerase specialized sigma24 family protein